jgi:hypothetical protein
MWLWLMPLNVVFPAFRIGATPVGAITDAWSAVAPPSRPLTAAATIMLFIEFFIGLPSIGFGSPHQARF